MGKPGSKSRSIMKTLVVNPGELWGNLGVNQGELWRNLGVNPGE